MKFVVAFLSFLLLSASTPPSAGYLFVWAMDADGQQSDFLAVVDLDRASPSFGTIVATIPTGVKNGKSHHTEHEMPDGGILFANGFGAGQTWLFDLNQPRTPIIRASFTDAGAMMHPHSFVRLPNGNVLATFQMTGHDNAVPGGLAEIDNQGKIVRTAPLTGLPEGEFVRPYSLAIVPKLDRIVTTSTDMHTDGPARSVQIWRLSDLKYLSTVILPPGPRGGENALPSEPRLLGDGRTVLVGTFSCGLYLLDGLASPSPSARLVHDFVGPGQCALPVVAGHYWVQASASVPGLVSLDILNPARPRVVDNLKLGADERPHWISLAPDGKRIVISGRGTMESRLLVATIDRATGKLALDPSIDINFDRQSWPHGDSGKAIPHGAVFSR
ncbi:MAG: hypothetical protein ABI617_03305 [Sphingomicrobium sp.]